MPDPVIGQTITDIRPMTDDELEREGWERDFHDNSLVMVLSDGTLLFPSRDEEGNGPGVFFGMRTNGEGFALAPSAAT